MGLTGYEGFKKKKFRKKVRDDDSPIRDINEVIKPYTIKTQVPVANTKPVKLLSKK